MIVREQKEDGASLVYKPSTSVLADYWLKLIPKDPTFVPSEDMQQELMEAMVDRFPNHEIEGYLYQRVEFIDPGGNFESISCNHCSMDIDMELWSESMSLWYESGTDNLDYITPCCNSESNLNSLLYNSPSGFSKYVIMVNGVDSSPEFVDDVTNMIGKVAKEEFRVVWTKY